VNGFDVTETTVDEVVEHAADAKEFLDTEAAACENTETYEELSVSVDVGNFRIVGDIDHLRVTPEAFIITDYKTNRLDSRTIENLAEHYRPQMMSYALALLEYDPDRTVIANLRFTEMGEAESFNWDVTDRPALIEELSYIGKRSID
jgi:ATP-dependent helicase/nuclease subunit A